MPDSRNDQFERIMRSNIDPSHDLEFFGVYHCFKDDVHGLSSSFKQKYIWMRSVKLSNRYT